MKNYCFGIDVGGTTSKMRTVPDADGELCWKNGKSRPAPKTAEAKISCADIAKSDKSKNG